MRANAAKRSGRNTHCDSLFSRSLVSWSSAQSSFTEGSAWEVATVKVRAAETEPATKPLNRAENILAVQRAGQTAAQSFSSLTEAFRSAGREKTFAAACSLSGSLLGVCSVGFSW